MVEKDGDRLIVKNSGKPPLTLIKSDGGYTYDTTDVVAIRYRLLELGADSIYYVIDIGQSLHMQQVFDVAREAGWLNDKHVEHVAFGLVLSDSGTKFKSRDGNTIKLQQLLDEAVNRAFAIIKDKNPNLTDEEINKVVDAVAYGSIKYADLSGTRTNNYTFSFDRMLSFTGNTAPYLIYAYVRIESILRNSGEHRKIMFNHIDNLNIEHVAEISLAKYIIQFPEILDKVSNSLMFHTLCNYLYTLSTEFHNFFTKCRCIHYNEDGEITSVEYSRLLLCESIRRIMEKCFYILGLQTLEKM